MNVFALGSLLVSMMAIFLGGLALHREPRSATNRVFFLFCLSSAYLHFIEFGYRQAESLATASFWMQLGILWPLALPLELHFVLLFTDKTRFLKNKLAYLALYGPALAISALHLTDLFPVEPVKVYWGWTYSLPGNQMVDGLIDIWVLVLAFLSLFFCWRYYQRTTENTRKQQALYVFWGLTTSTAVGLITDLVPPYLGVRIPELTGLGVTFQCIFIGWAIWKYRLFALALATAAESIISTMADVLLMVGPGGRIETTNQAAVKLFGYKESELIDQPVEMLLAQEEKAKFKETGFRQLLKEGPVSDAEMMFESKDGKRIPLSLSGSLLRNDDGVAQGMVLVGRDLTERVQAEGRIRASLQEKEVLLKEIHHRVKNNLQVISSLLYLQSKDVAEEQTLQMFEESRGRVRAMALVHERLYRSQDLARVDFGEYVRNLADYLFQSYGVDEGLIGLTVDVEDVYLDLDTAIPCGLILNELISNSLKHAFPDGRAGEIDIRFRSDSGHQHTLVVSDSGVGFADGFHFQKTSSLGLKLVDTLVNQLEGSIELDRSSGTTFRVAFSEQTTPVVRERRADLSA